MLTKETITPEDREQLSYLIKVIGKYGDSKWHNAMGEAMFKLFTEQGLPPEFFLDDVEKKNKLTTEEKVYITHIYQSLFMKHRLKAGLGEKTQQKIQNHNRKVINKIIKTGEFETL